MTPEQILQECETLTYNGRMRRMVELGHEASIDVSIADTLATLAQGDVYQRTLALQSCFGSYNFTQVLGALSDPSRSVRGRALGLVAITCSNANVQAALDTIPLPMKNALLAHLQSRHRQAPIDAYLETLAARQDAALKKLLHFGSHEVVVRHLSQVSEHYDLSNWRKLASRHPSIAVEQLSTLAASIGFPDQRLILQVNAVLSSLASLAPDLALTLVRAVTDIIPLTQLDLEMLAKVRAHEIADLLLQSDEANSLSFDAMAQRLDTERLLALLTRYSRTISSHSFQRLTPQRRLAIYTACAHGWCTDEGVLAYDIVAALPTEQRIQEGRRHLVLPALATRPIQRLLYAAFLPWDEARTTLEASLRSPDADLRGVALRTLITTTRYQRDHLADALMLVRERRNEQDPIRLIMLAVLDSLPSSMWRGEHLTDLAQIIRDALDASDRSTATTYVIERLVLHLLPFHPAWSASQLPQIYRESGRVSFYGLDTFLSAADTRHIAPALIPVFQAWQEREGEWQLVTLANAFGRRLRVFPELADILEVMLNRTVTLGIADFILRLFSEHCRDRLDRLVPALLAQDKSYIVMQPVYMYLHRCRQDLLTPFLGQHAYKGKFSTGLTRIVLSFENGFFRWTPTQQDIFAHTLLDVANDEKQATPALMEAIQQLASMAFINPSYIIAYASDERQPVRDTALRALGRLDAGQGILVLLEALNDDRARIAIYALRNSLLSMPEAEALHLLRNAPLHRVTVAKEVVRLIGDLSSEAAFIELQAIDTRTLHRDVRVALLRALWPYVERSETWEIFTRAAQAPDITLARGVINIPADSLSPLAQRRLASLLATVLDRPEPEIRVEVLQRCTRNPLTDYDHVILSRVLRSLRSHVPDEYTQAAQALFTLYTGKDATQVGDAIHDLLSKRRVLQVVINNFLSALHSNRQRLLPTTRAILAALSQDRLVTSLQVRIILSGLPWDEVATELVQLVDKLHADALIQAEIAVQWAYIRPDADLSKLEMTLAQSNDERLRRLALAALLAQASQINGWSDALVARLHAYRQDSSPLVAEAAQFTFIPLE